MLLRYVILGIVLSSIALRAAETIRWTSPSTNGMRDLAEFLAPFQKRLELPALAAAVVRETKITAAGVTGERKFGSGVKVQLDDKFHIGSCTKSMTALLAADLVRADKLSFDATVGSVFPEWMLDDLKAGITLTLLLQNRSGLGGKASPALWRRAFNDLKGTPPEQRQEFLRGVLAESLEAEPGSKYIYSNLGFALAGAMIEDVLHTSWEELTRQRIFRPLGLGTAGFGPPAQPDNVNQPWGHQLRDGVLTPLPPSDNPVAIAPAGLVHMSILDLARYAAFHIQTFNGEVTELKDYRDELYTPPDGSDYAFGWIVQKRKWAGGTVLTHAGSNTTFYTVIWIAPAKKFAFIVATNMAEKAVDVTGEKCDQVVAALIKDFIP